MNRPAPTPADFEALQERFARRCTARLDAGELPHDITERLRAAREQALAARRAAAAAPANAVLHGGGGTAVLGGGSWRWLAPALLLALLAAASILFTSQQAQPARPTPAPMPVMGAVGAKSAAGARSIAPSPVTLIDVALVTDPLPPSAYADPGFMHFLRQTATNPDLTPPGEHIIATPAVVTPAAATPSAPETAPQ